MTAAESSDQEVVADIRETIAAALPLKLNEYDSVYHDLGWMNFGGYDSWGARWSVNISCAARFVAPDFSWNSAEEESSLAVYGRILGCDLVRVDIAENLVAAVFHFSGNQLLAVIADEDYASWSLSVPGLGRLYGDWLG